MNLLEFHIHLDDERIVKAIRAAEARSSLELRVYVADVVADRISSRKVAVCDRLAHHSDEGSTVSVAVIELASGGHWNADRGEVARPDVVFVQIDVVVSATVQRIRATVRAVGEQPARRDRRRDHSTT